MFYILPGIRPLLYPKPSLFMPVRFLQTLFQHEVVRLIGCIEVGPDATFVACCVLNIRDLSLSHHPVPRDDGD